jgi:hypothetical protein
MADPNIQRHIQTEFIADPLGYVLFAFPWGKKGTILENFPEGPDVWAREEFERLRQHILENARRAEQSTPEKVLRPKPFYLAIASGHGIGKSCWFALFILWLMSTRPNCRGIVTANTGDQLQGKTWPELSKWHQLAINRDWFRWTATKFSCVLPGKDGTSNEENWKFDAVTWSEERPEAFAGLHNAGSAVALLNDEASLLHRKIWEVQDGAMSDGEAFQISFGNPTVNTGRFKECFTGPFRDRYHHRHIDSRDVRITNKEKIAEDIALYGEDSDYVRVRIKGQFPRVGDKQFISGEAVERAQSRVIEVRDPGAPLILGVDVAMGGANKTVLRWRWGDDARTIPARKYSESDTMVLADLIAKAIDETNPDAVVLDAGGGGKQIGDILKLRGYKVHVVWFGSSSSSKEWSDKRTEMWAALRDWLPGAYLPGDQQLYDDLVAPERRPFGKQGEVTKLESKEEMVSRGVASPDDGDALACTFGVRVARADIKAGRGRGRARGRIAQGVDSNQFGE